MTIRCLQSSRGWARTRAVRTESRITIISSVREVWANVCDVGRWRDWLGRVELADWFTTTGFPQIAALFTDRAAITDKDSYLDWWPCGVGSFQFWRDFDDQVTVAAKAAGLGVPDDTGAAISLAENALADHAPIAGRRDGLRNRLDKLAAAELPGTPVPEVPDCSDLWMYAEPLWAIARPYARRTAEEVCALIGWDPLSPAPRPGTRCTRSATRRAVTVDQGQPGFGA